VHKNEEIAGVVEAATELLPKHHLFGVGEATYLSIVGSQVTSKYLHKELGRERFRAILSPLPAIPNTGRSRWVLGPAPHLTQGTGSEEDAFTWTCVVNPS